MVARTRARGHGKRDHGTFQRRVRDVAQLGGSAGALLLPQHQDGERGGRLHRRREKLDRRTRTRAHQGGTRASVRGEVPGHGQKNRRDLREGTRAREEGKTRAGSQACVQRRGGAVVHAQRPGARRARAHASVQRNLRGTRCGENDPHEMRNPRGQISRRAPHRRPERALAKMVLQ